VPRYPRDKRSGTNATSKLTLTSATILAVNSLRRLSSSTHPLCVLDQWHACIYWAAHIVSAMEVHGEGSLPQSSTLPEHMDTIIGFKTAGSGSFQILQFLLLEIPLCVDQQSTCPLGGIYHGKSFGYTLLARFSTLDRRRQKRKDNCHHNPHNDRTTLTS
jgi:hypothetical protein